MFELFLNDYCSVIKEQVIRTKRDEMYLKPRGGTVYSHPMNSHAGLHAVPVVKNFIKSEDAKVSWKCESNDSIQSSVGCFQLFSDKSQKSLKERTLSLYHLHLTLLNVSEERRQSHIVSERSICAYLPVQFQHTENIPKNIRTEASNETNTKKSRTNILEDLHESIITCMRSLARAAVPGLTCRSADRTDILFHTPLTSYMADTPECEDMHLVKRGTQTSSLCHICLVKRDEFNLT